MSPRQQSPYTSYVDANGKSWRRRGTGPKSRKALLELLLDPRVVVIHVYLWDEPQVIAPPDRAAFWRGAEDKMAASAFATFDGSEYVDDDHVHLLVIGESC